MRAQPTLETPWSKYLRPTRIPAPDFNSQLSNLVCKGKVKLRERYRLIR